MAELRVFYNPKEIIFDLWKNIANNNAKAEKKFKKMKPEVRTDHCIPVNDPILGLKLRGGKSLELKVRTEKHQSGVEIW